ncbi:KP78b [Carabus blaptoides fortunei]
METHLDIKSLCTKVHETYTITKGIGEGSFGEVFEAEHNILNFKVAIKKCSKERVKEFCRELLSLNKLNHPNIISMFHVYSLDLAYYIVMELAPGCNLYTYLNNNNMRVKENTCRIIGRQLASALCHMHNISIVHRDIKPENIVLNETTMQIKLLDFGLSDTLDNKAGLTQFCGTPGYMAPEVVQNKLYSAQIDMWSLGIVFYEMITGMLPDLIPSETKTRRTKVPKDLEEIVKAHLQLEAVRNCSVQFQNLLANLLQLDPLKRIDSARLCKHPWLTENFKSPILTCGYETLPALTRFRIYKQLATLTNKTMGQTVNLIETTSRQHHFPGMLRMLILPELEKLYFNNLINISNHKRTLDDCNVCPRTILKNKSVQA